jgi:hypothetical protein
LEHSSDYCSFDPLIGEWSQIEIFLKYSKMTNWFVSQVRLEQPEDLAIKHRKESTDAIYFAAAEVTTPEEF